MHNDPLPSVEDYIERGNFMKKNYTPKDIEDGRKISELFSRLSEENKTMAIVYLSALRDKEVADSGKKELLGI